MKFSTFSKLAAIAGGMLLSAGLQAQTYTPAPANLEARKVFQDNKYGLFVHWGLSSMLGDGEWVMNNRNIRVEDYKRLQPAFYPGRFDANEWVQTAKKAGMKYIVFITRHHDGFPIGTLNNPIGKSPILPLSGMC
jgi:alpha-L-fucosidase